MFPAVFDQYFEQAQQKYSVPFLEASHSILVPQLGDQSLPLILLYQLRCPLKSKFFQNDPYNR